MSDTNNSYTFTGTVYDIGEVEKVGKNGFPKRSVVLEDPNHTKMGAKCLVKFDALGRGDVTMFDGLKVGDVATVRFHLEGWEYNGKFYVNLVATDMQKHEDDGGGTVTAEAGMDCEAAADEALPF